MSVYVDDMEAAYGRMKMCHMWADTYPELIEMVRRIDVDIKWLQFPPNASWVHYDVSLGKRTLAVQAGAIEKRWRDIRYADKVQKLDPSYAGFYPGFIEGYAAGSDGQPMSACPYSYLADPIRYGWWGSGHLWAWRELGISPPPTVYDDDIPF